MIIIEYCGKERYLECHGWHFTKGMCEFAVSHMTKNGLPISMLSKETVDTYLRNAGLTLKHDHLYDAVYVANMAYSDFYGSSIQDDIQLAKYIKDYIDDEDAYEGMPFARFLMDIERKDCEIDWDDMI